jgi:hypothetical protein
MTMDWWLPCCFIFAGRLSNTYVKLVPRVNHLEFLSFCRSSIYEDGLMIAVLFFFCGRLSNTYVKLVPRVNSTVVLAFCTTRGEAKRMCVWLPVVADTQHTYTHTAEHIPYAYIRMSHDELRTTHNTGGNRLRQDTLLGLNRQKAESPPVRANYYGCLSFQGVYNWSWISHSILSVSIAWVLDFWCKAHDEYHPYS